MRQWMVAAKKADFYVIAEKFHVDPVVARIYYTELGTPITK